MVDKPSDTHEFDWWRAMMATNADSAYYLAKLAIQSMSAKGSGSIVFISSVGAIRPHYTLEAYDASKAAIDSLTRSLGMEYSRQGIRVNGIAPGAIQTQYNLSKDPAQAGSIDWAIRTKDLEQALIPMGRYGVSAEIASVVAFLASEQASYITGQTICVDGGVIQQVCPRGMWI
jgi:3-oxoacyl-[acyl-carrier protein] reductase